MIPQARASPADQNPSSSPCSLLKYQRRLWGWSQRDMAEAFSQLCAIAGSPGTGVNVGMVSRPDHGCSKHGPLKHFHLSTLYGQAADQLGLLGELEVRR